MSKIEWTDQTWNPIVGCSIVSPGCTNCYAMKMAARLEAMHVPHYSNLTQKSKAGHVWTGELSKAPDSIWREPLRRKKPTTYFVNSMGDLFHEDVPDEWILQVLDVIRRTSHDGGANCGTIRHADRREGQHVYQVLTKRSARMRDVMRRLRWNGERLLLADDDSQARVILGNLWLGVSTERQLEADARIPDLLATPAAVRFVSAEPLLGPIDFDAVSVTVTPGFFGSALRWHHRGYCHEREGIAYPTIDWIIVGGESGPGARPMVLGWAKEIVRQCRAAEVPVFVKQMGAHPTNREGQRCPRITHKKGALISEWPDELRVRELPNNAMPAAT